MIGDVDAALRDLLTPGAREHGAEVSFEAPTRDWGARRSTPTLDVYLFDIREDVDLRSVAREPVWEPSAPDDEAPGRGDGRAEDRVEDRDGGAEDPGSTGPATGRMTARAVPPRFFRLSYLLTAWTSGPEDEHRMLADALRTLVVLDTVPDSALSGRLTEQPYTVRLEVAQPVGEDRTISELWTALGGELKPSLDVVVTAPLDAALTFPVAAPVSRRDLSAVPRP